MTLVLIITPEMFEAKPWNRCKSCARAKTTRSAKMTSTRWSKSCKNSPKNSTTKLSPWQKPRRKRLKLPDALSSLLSPTIIVFFFFFFFFVRLCIWRKFLFACSVRQISGFSFYFSSLFFFSLCKTNTTHKPSPPQKQKKINPCTLNRWQGSMHQWPDTLLWKGE